MYSSKGGNKVMYLIYCNGVRIFSHSNIEVIAMMWLCWQTLWKHKTYKLVYESQDVHTVIAFRKGE